MLFMLRQHGRVCRVHVSRAGSQVAGSGAGMQDGKVVASKECRAFACLSRCFLFSFM